ncbi:MULTISPECIES: tape measure protein [Achromobacter]|uniref:Tape measure protein n=1 Tax=Achromobacter spanius TaxID=217203 RepID=A0ABY8H0T9_9BURK|nr:MULTISPECIES: tape measure protein [Achromobacter]WAI85840.1 tape measure protein [Achromobacter spanius]WEX95921.1 tape measure protein [Achromobacter sp. SS2-2022]WFP10359.1 tape measure protein [Achromobacter spanius]
MIVVREVVTLLRHHVDTSGLQAYQQAFEAMLQSMADATVRASAAMRRALAGVLPSVVSTQQAIRVLATSGPTISRQATSGQAAGGRATSGQATGGLATSGQATSAQATNPQAKSAVARPQGGIPAPRQHATALGGLRGVVELTLGASPLKRILSGIDAWVQIQERLRQAAGSGAQAVEADRDLARVSRASRTPYADNVDTYARSAQTLQDHGRSPRDAAGITEAVALAMRLSQTPAEDRGGVVAALLKMVEQGRLGLEEYNALPRRMQDALAAGLNVDRVQLRQQVQGGQVSADRALPALQSQLPAMRTEAEAAPASITAAMTVFNDALQRYVGQALPAGRSVLNGVTASILFLADNIDAVVKLLALTGASIGLVSLGNWLRRASVLSVGLFQALVAATRAALGLDAAMAMRRGPAGAMQMLSVWSRSLAPMLRMAAVLTTIYLIGEDIANWLGGGDSVLGGWIGGVEQWQDELNAVSAVLGFVKDLLGGAGEALGPWIQRFGTIGVLAYGLWQILSPIGGFLLNLATVVVPMLWNAFAMTPIGRIISLIGMLAVALWQVWENWDVIKAYISASWDALMAMALDSFLGPVIEYIAAIWQFWTALVNGVVAAFKGDWDGAIAHWAGAFNGLWTFFSNMGGRMMATIKQIGDAIQTWVLDKLKVAKDWFLSLVPDALKSEPDAQASVMDGWKSEGQQGGQQGLQSGALPSDQAAWWAVASGVSLPVVPPANVFGPGPLPGRAPFMYQNRNDIVVNVSGGDSQAVRGAVAQGVDQGLYRNFNYLTNAWDLASPVEATT